jgi:hypothetical protein
MKRSADLRKTASNLPESLLLQLDMYTVAATAAGVGMLALAQPAEAKIVYTPAHVMVAQHERYGIDLDHDGTTDISLGRGPDEGATYVFASGRNGVAAQLDNNRWAVAIFRGAKIGPSRHFVESSSFRPQLACGSGSGTGSAKWRGQWADGGKGVKNRYLGIKFKSGGQFHYGWARVTITIDRAAISSVVLTGYAYETIPNKPIIAGKTKGHDEDSSTEQANTALLSTSAPASLGLLAMGAPGLSIWRREERSGATR